MRAQERQGIVIDLCRDCRGMFLDRGELDRLLDLEAAAPVPGGAGNRYDDRSYRRDDDRYDADDDDVRDRGAPQQRRRRGFLGDLLEGFGD